MGRKLFKIVGGFSYGAGALALIISMVLLVIAATQFFGDIDENIAQPDVTLEQYLNNKRTENATTTATTKEPSEESLNTEVPETDQQYQKARKILLNQIVDALNSFSQVTKQGSVSQGSLENYLLHSTQGLDRNQYLKFLEALANETEALEARAKEVANSSKESFSSVRWGKFIFWFTSSYMEKYQQELKRIENEKSEQAKNRIVSITTAGSAAVTFVIFVFFMLILLLVQIELNTRKAQEGIAILRDPKKPNV